MSPRSRRAAFVAIVLILLALGAFYPIPIGRRRDRLARALSNELGRRVSFSDVHLHLLPKPGFIIDGPFVVEDDPAFSAEPLLRADSVSADMRLASLWRGRWEIASISLENPSINLVRDDAGHWNLESLVLRASQTPTAPTSKTRAESARLRFPYVKVSDARFNVKFGLLKSVFALTEADASLWLESDDKWNLRLKAKPVRTDVPIADTGTIKFDGRVGRAAHIGDLPFEGIAEVNDAQLGQLSKLLVGRDAGWRGALDGELSGQGTLAHLKIASKLRVTQFRRYDVANEDAVGLSTDCSGTQNYELDSSGNGQRSFDDLSCTSKLGTGELLVKGSVAHEYAVQVVAKNLPAADLASIYRNVQQNVPSDFRARGVVNGTFQLAPNHLSGGGSIVGLAIASAKLKQPLQFNQPLTFASEPNSPDVALHPAQIEGLGSISGRANAREYEFGLQADSDLLNLLSVAQTLGVATPFQPAEGHAAGTLRVSGTWFGYARPELTGDLALTGVSAGDDQHRVLLHSAQLAIRPQQAALTSITAELPSAKLSLTGSVAVVRPCGIPTDCAYSVDLRTPLLDSSALKNALAPNQNLLASLLSRDTPLQRYRDTLSRLNVTGRIGAARFTLPQRALQSVVTDFRLRDGVLAIAEFAAALDSGGQVLARNSTVDFNSGEPAYMLDLGLDRVPLASLLSPDQAPRMPGLLTAQMQLTMKGDSVDSLKRSAQGSTRFELTNGTLSTPSSRFGYRRLTATALIADEKITLQDGASVTGAAGATWHVTGSADLARSVDVHLIRGTDHVDVVGPLAPASK